MPTSKTPLLALALASLAFAVSACEPGPSPAACDPAADAFARDVQPRLERWCGSCHGETPNFGAPSSLLDHAMLIAIRPDGTRLVDRIAARLADGSMPPAGMPRIPDAEAQAIADWASCGEIAVPPATGLRASAPPYLSPDDAPTGLATIDFLAREQVVGPDVTDLYQCFVYDADIDAERFVRRFEMVYDETRVLHHLVLLRDPDRHSPEGGTFECEGGSGMPPGSQYLYAWAPGLGPLQFPDGGLRIAPGERFIVQLHYNNGPRIPDVRDSSGVRLFVGPPEGTEYGLQAIGPLDFQIAPRATATVTSRCTFATESRVLATWPHMHRIGSSFVQRIERAGGGTAEEHISLSGWEFESQLIYDTPATLRAGDVVTTSCTFANDTPGPVSAGTATDDEMCFGFWYVTPPPANRYCDEGDTDTPTDVRYVADACALDAPAEDPALVRGRWTEQAEPPALTAASVPDARWELESITFYVSDATTPIGQIDLDATYVLGRGRLWTEGGRLALDIDSHVVVRSVEGLTFSSPGSFGFGGPFDEASTPATITLDCPANATMPARFDWGLDGDRLTIGFTSMEVPDATLWPRYTFRRAPG